MSRTSIIVGLAFGAVLAGCSQGPPAQEPTPTSSITVTPEQAANATGRSEAVVPKSREEAIVYEPAANPDIEADQAAGNAATRTPR